jgi:hypothetical protein
MVCIVMYVVFIVFRSVEKRTDENRRAAGRPKKYGRMHKHHKRRGKKDKKRRTVNKHRFSTELAKKQS